MNRIVVVTFNSARTIFRCLSALVGSVRRASEPWEVVVVDNDSEDNTVEVIQDAFPYYVRIVESGGNLGFAAGVNLGATGMCPGALLLMLNPDCFVSDQTLSSLGEWLRSHPGDACTARLMRPDGSLQQSAGRTPLPSTLLKLTLTGATRRRRLTFLNERGGDTGKPRRVDWATMACFAVPYDVFQLLGGLDERYWLFGEDLDFCDRLREVGGDVWWLPTTTATHIGDHSADQIDWGVVNLYAEPLLRFLMDRGLHGQVLLLRLVWVPRFLSRSIRLGVRHDRAGARRAFRSALVALSWQRTHPDSLRSAALRRSKQSGPPDPTSAP